MEIARIEPGDGQAVAVTGQRNRMQIGFGGLRCRAVHVLEELIGLGARYAAALIGDLHTDVLLAATNGHLERRQRIAIVMIVMLDNGTHRVLEQLEEHIVQMRRHVHGPDGCTLIRAAVLLDLQRWAGQIVLITEKAGILVRIAHHVRQIAGGIQAADVPAQRMRAGAEEQGCTARS